MLRTLLLVCDMCRMVLYARMHVGVACRTTIATHLEAKVLSFDFKMSGSPASPTRSAAIVGPSGCVANFSKQFTAATTDIASLAESNVPWASWMAKLGCNFALAQMFAKSPCKLSTMSMASATVDRSFERSCFLAIAEL